MHQHFTLRLALPALVLFAGTALSNTIDSQGINPKHVILVDRAVRPSHAELEAECGELGVMEVPEGANPLEYRHCLNHPDSVNPTSKSPAVSDINSGTTLNQELQAMACLRNPRSRGCSVGNGSQHYCWNSCGDNWQLDQGYWCWLAWNGGTGDWVRCNSEGDAVNCQVAIDNGANCAQGGCASCGCSC